MKEILIILKFFLIWMLEVTKYLHGKFQIDEYLKKKKISDNFNLNLKTIAK